MASYRQTKVAIAWQIRQRYQQASQVYSNLGIRQNRRCDAKYGADKLLPASAT